MGIRLVKEVLDHAPADLPASDRLMLVVLAESARDETRACFPGNDVLAQRNGVDPRSVRRTLTRLEGRGLIERDEVGTDRNGRPIYAHRGHATVYRIARLAVAEPVPLPVPPAPVEDPESRTPLSPIDEGKADARVLHLAEKGGQPRPERGTPVTGKADTAVPPPLTVPSGNPHPRGRSRDERAAVIDAVRERTGRTIPDDHADRVVAQLLAGRSDIRYRAAYLRSAVHRDPNPDRFVPTPIPPRYRREDDAAHA